MELKQYIALARRWWWLLALLAILGGIGGYAGYRYALQQNEAVYESTTSLLLSQSQEELPDAEAVTQGSRLAETYSELILKRSILETVIANLDLVTTPEDLLEEIEVRNVPNTNLLELSVQGTNPGRTAAIANEIANVFIEENQSRQTSRYQTTKQQLESDIDAAQGEIADLRSQIGQINTEIGTSQNRLDNIYDQIESANQRLEQIPTEIGVKQTRIDAINELSSFQLNENPDYRIELRTLAQEVEDLEAEQTRLQTRLPELEAEATGLETSISDLNAELGPLEIRLSQTETQYQSLLRSYEDVRLRETEVSEFMSVVEPAISGERVNPLQPPSLFVLQGMIVGLALAVGAVLLIEYLNDTVRTSNEVEAATGVPTLGVIGRIQNPINPEDILVSAHQPRTSISEAYRVLQANLEFIGKEKAIQSILVTSSGPVEGKTTTAVNLAVTMAKAGRRVILVDLDLRRPRVHTVFGIKNKLGVTTALLDNDLGQHLTRTDIDNLLILASGPLPPNPADLFQSARMSELMMELKASADMVIIDTPPVMPVADAILLSRVCDAVVLVAMAENTRLDVLKKSQETLEQTGADVLGVVLNYVDASQNGYYYNQYYYYSSDPER